MPTQADQIRTLRARVGALERVLLTLIEKLPEQRREDIAAAVRRSEWGEPGLVAREADIEQAENGFVDWITGTRQFRR